MAIIGGLRVGLHLRLTHGQPATFTVLQSANGGGTQGDVEILRNGLTIGTGTAYHPPVISRDVNRLGRGYDSWEIPYKGDIAMVLVYDRLLDQAEIDQVYAYFDVQYFGGGEIAPAVPGLGPMGGLALLTSLLASGRAALRRPRA